MRGVTLLSAIFGAFMSTGYLTSTNGMQPVVQWHAEHVAIYDYEKHVTLYLCVTEPRMRNVEIGLLSYGIGLSVTDDASIPQTAIIPQGKYIGGINVSLADAVVGDTSENGYKKLRIRLNEVLSGSAILGGYGFLEIMDINILGQATSVTGCHSGSFRNSHLVVNEGDRTALLTFIVNGPLPRDLKFGYRVNLEWTATASHALHEIDYRYHVTHHKEGDYKYVTLPAGDTSFDIPINIIDDDISEDTEQFMVQLEHRHLSPVINILGDSVVVDIVDNDRCIEPAGSRYYAGSCYFKVSLPDMSRLGTEDARHLCAEHDGYLAIIRNEVENAIVSDIADDGEAWIGAVRDPDDLETFIWEDGSSLTFESWRQREPSNYAGNENCVTTNYVRFGLWNDRICTPNNMVFFGVCEKPALSNSGGFETVE